MIPTFIRKCSKEKGISISK